MPIQVYSCLKDGEQDIFMRTFEVPPRIDCPTCGQKIKHIISAPAIVDIRRDWNENANEYRRDPYTQAKAQIRNKQREDLERDIPIQKISEEGIQAGAAAIHDSNTKRRPSIEQKAKRHFAKRTKETPNESS